MISFIVSAFERPNSLRTCLASLVDQSYTDWRSVVVDNSIDLNLAIRNRELCDLDSRIRYEWTSDRTKRDGEHTRCLYTATEIGVTMARGEWLCFPNDDTSYPSVFAERMIEAAEASCLDLIYSNFILGGPVMDYRPVQSNPWNCSCDKTSFIVKRSWFKGFSAKESHYALADGMLLEELVRRGIKHGRLNQYLVVHN